MISHIERSDYLQFEEKDTALFWYEIGQLSTSEINCYKQAYKQQAGIDASQ